MFCRQIVVSSFVREEKESNDKREKKMIGLSAYIIWGKKLMARADSFIEQTISGKMRIGNRKITTEL